jgi:hypothetical protein
MISTVIPSPSPLVTVVGINAESALTAHHTNMGSETAISWEEKQKINKITKENRTKKYIKCEREKSTQENT